MQEKAKTNGSLMILLLKDRKPFQKKKEPSEKEAAMLEMLKAGGDFVSEETLGAFLGWYESL